MAFVLGIGACSPRSLPDEDTVAAAMSARTLGLAYLEEDRFLEATTELNRLIELLPGEAIGYANLALAQLRTRNLAAALQSSERAIELAGNDPDIRFNHSVILEASNRIEAAVGVLRANVTNHPNHLRSAYALIRLNRVSASPVARQLSQILDRRPANIVARLELIDALLVIGDAEGAVEHVEYVARQMPELPPEAVDPYREALRLVRAGDPAGARPPATTFHNLLRSTRLYQAGVEELIGRPAFPGISVERFRPELLELIENRELVRKTIEFTLLQTLALDENGRTAWTGGTVSGGDYDGDGNTDLLVTLRDDGTGNSAVFLLKNERGTIVDAPSPLRIPSRFRATSGRFIDYDDDGELDVILTGTVSIQLYRNSGDGHFENVTAAAGLAGAPGAITSLAGDFDHDGDLDLYLGRSGTNRYYRNDGFGSFEEKTGATDLGGGGGGDGNSVRLAYGDFDNDFDLDILVGNAGGHPALFMNLRQGHFEDVALNIGLGPDDEVMGTNDLNNDGFLDIVANGPGGASILVNSGNGIFAARGEDPALPAFGSLEFLDFDNDGFLDLLATSSDAGTLLLLRNQSGETFSDASSILPALEGLYLATTTVDIDSDGDMDIVVILSDGTLAVLRNDGGNTNNYLKIQLAGLGQGSNKNNHFGFGARIEVRAGESYQTRIVTSVVTHFGLGGHSNAETVRITWTNGVPQNSFLQSSNQLVVEDQILKGSCAFLYTWNGEEYVFLTDMMWKSALGMPLGIMGSAMAYGPPDASREYLLIPGSQLQPLDGRYLLQITEELWEVAYLDQLELVVYDHPDSVEIFVDEKFVPPFITDVEFFHVSEQRLPLSATDQDGVDLLPQISRHDFRFVANLVADRYQGITELHDLVLDLGDFDRGETVRLFLNGWLFPTDASTNVALSQSGNLRVVFPYLQVRNEMGQWETVVENISFPQGKNKTMVVDLTGKFRSASREIRIRTNMEIYWDYIFFSLGPGNSPVRRTRLQPTSADLHFRGFSRLYRRGGRYGPHWFDYSQVSTDRKWLPMVGTYTRYGDVLPLLLDPDDMYVIIREGDEISVSFDATAVPSLPDGWSRDFLIYSDGFLKDADLNTLTGRTIEPMPFHAMTSYPYGSREAYPTDSAHVEYLRVYNTRRVQVHD